LYTLAETVSMTTTTCVEVAVKSEPNPFRWFEIEQEPKVLRSCIRRCFRSTEYEILHTGGFLRLCTQRGRVYWLAQNEHDHRLPDWKLHFSVELRHVPKAWDVISELFMLKACDFGMKAVAGEAFENWPERQRGRELTVYIFQHHAAYADGGPMMGSCPGQEHEFWLGPEFERESFFWADFVQDAEKKLAAAGVRSRGVADGDFPLGKYASIRNEAFVLDASKNFVYPPNIDGWNAAAHHCPLQLSLMQRLRHRSILVYMMACRLLAPCCPHRATATSGQRRLAD